MANFDLPLMQGLIGLVAEPVVLRSGSHGLVVGEDAGIGDLGSTADAKDMPDFARVGSVAGDGIMGCRRPFVFSMLRLVIVQVTWVNEQALALE